MASWLEATVASAPVAVSALSPLEACVPARCRLGRQHRGSVDDLRDGFIHFSTGDQLAEILRRHVASQRDLVLIAVDPENLGPRLRREASRGGDLFPHHYGELPVSFACHAFR